MAIITPRFSITFVCILSDEPLLNLFLSRFLAETGGNGFQVLPFHLKSGRTARKKSFT
jgi:hypothetical protein